MDSRGVSLVLLYHGWDCLCRIPVSQLLSCHDPSIAEMQRSSDGGTHGRIARYVFSEYPKGALGRRTILQSST